MIDVTEVLAELFQKRPEADADGVFHYLLQEKDDKLVVDVTPYRQWTPEALEFWIGRREFFYQAIYDEQTYRVLASSTPPRL